MLHVLFWLELLCAIAPEEQAKVTATTNVIQRILVSDFWDEFTDTQAM